jgi:hypothetical protein
MSDNSSRVAEIAAHRRRLALLRERAAQQGASVDPGVLIEIEDINRQLRELGADDSAPASAADAPWWASLAGQSRGDVIVGQVGANASNVAIGKQITQQVGAGAGDDRATIDGRLALLDSALAHATLDPALRGMAEFQLGLLRAELQQEGASSSTTVMRVVDWLLEQAPSLQAALRELCTSPALMRRLASDAAAAWVRQRFPAA